MAWKEVLGDMYEGMMANPIYLWCREPLVLAYKNYNDQMRK